MRYYTLLIFLALFMACSDDDGPESEFTGNEMVYNLTPDPQYYTGSGTVIFKAVSYTHLTLPTTSRV